MVSETIFDIYLNAIYSMCVIHGNGKLFIIIEIYFLLTLVMVHLQLHTQSKMVCHFHLIVALLDRVIHQSVVVLLFLVVNVL